MREARCSCGQLSLSIEGEPVRVTMCHCLECKRRTGSAFAVQARFPKERVKVTGTASVYTRIADSGRKAFFSFCPHCASTVHYALEDQPNLVAVPIGAFADPSFQQPQFSFYDERRHPWVQLPWALIAAGWVEEVRGDEAVTDGPHIEHISPTRVLMHFETASGFHCRLFDQGQIHAEGRAKDVATFLADR